MSDLNRPLVGLKCSECRDHKSGLALPILEDQVKIAWDVLGLEINYSWRGLYLLSTLVSSCQSQASFKSMTTLSANHYTTFSPHLLHCV